MSEKLELFPISITDARIFVQKVHRHNNAPLGGLFAVAVKNGEIKGVAIVGRPIARRLQDGMTCEVTRVATDGEKNACSMLYGASVRAAKALGYKKIITYTLVSETGASLRASGWEKKCEIDPPDSWSCSSRPRYDNDLFGNKTRPTGKKIRWEKIL